ncbi:uncharacterized protein V1477_002075 [Vespula maculifrons]|uniref:Uncharacterized protein n=2 Tax=Vespula TaxID=7451 RepID=A0A834NTE3_VESGE|nr:uncharacterized protein LOC122632657 [Vespula pensylvanica]XP_050847462.1 uncharacterized protein LOC127062777 [Vespula vulgaris]KAF7417700.1 hypothetical protein HZH68_000353 [Vespula germanica]
MPEESEKPSFSSRLQKYLKEAPFFCKIIELILCIISIGLIVNPFNEIHREDIDHVAIVYVSLCGYILINAIIILCHLLGDRIPKKTAIAFSVMGAVLCLIAGLVLIRDWTEFPNNLIFRYVEQYSDQMISSGVFVIIAAIVFACDIYFINKYY